MIFDLWSTYSVETVLLLCFAYKNTENGTYALIFEILFLAIFPYLVYKRPPKSTPGKVL